MHQVAIKSSSTYRHQNIYSCEPTKEKSAILSFSLTFGRTVAIDGGVAVTAAAVSFARFRQRFRIANKSDLNGQ